MKETFKRKSSKSSEKVSGSKSQTSNRNSVEEIEISENKFQDEEVGDKQELNNSSSHIESNPFIEVHSGVLQEDVKTQRAVKEAAESQVMVLGLEKPNPTQV